MAKFLRNEKDVAYIKLTWLELAEYSHNMSPVCDECLKDLIGYNRGYDRRYSVDKAK